MAWLDKMMGGFNKKSESKQQEDLETIKTTLKSIVYDDELVEELTPVFAKLSAQEGFSKVIELLETKEAQLEKIAGGEWTQQLTESDYKPAADEDEEEDSKANLSADEILARKYSK